MLRLLILLSFAICLCGCSTPKADPGLPLWRYDQGVAADNQIRGNFAVGALWGAFPTLKVQDGIELPAPVLASVISKALMQTQSLQGTATLGALSLNATPRGTSGTSGTPSTWSVAEANEGQFITDWQQVSGKRAGILWWEKRYETEVRHVITVTTAYRSQILTSFTIKTEVRERPSSDYPWKDGDPELGRMSFETIRSTLVQAVQVEISSRRVKK